MSVPPHAGTIGRNPHHRDLFAGFSALAAVCLLGTMTMAQSRPGGLDGRQRLGGPALAAPGLPSTSETESGDAVEMAAVLMLLMAQKDLAEDRSASAQRTLEQLIARYPDTASAIDGRRTLYALYAADTAVTGGKPTPTETPVAAREARAGTHGVVSSSAGTPPAGPPDTALAVNRPAIGTGWRTSIVSFRRLQDDLRNSIGDRIFFSGASAELGSRARVVLAGQAAWLLGRPEIEIVVEGHADDTSAGGDDELLAGQRAVAVRDRLVQDGIDSGRIRLVMQGSRDRVATCDDSDCAAQNRRVVVLVGVRGSQAARNPTVMTGAGGGSVDQRR